jgi:hypothetical protein
MTEGHAGHQPVRRINSTCPDVTPTPRGSWFFSQPLPYPAGGRPRSVGKADTWVIAVCELDTRVLKRALQRLDCSFLQFTPPLKPSHRVDGDLGGRGELLLLCQIGTASGLELCNRS